MLRVVLLAFCLVAAVYLMVRIAAELRRDSIDWKGIGVTAGLILLAIYLRSVTEIGGIV